LHTDDASYSRLEASDFLDDLAARPFGFASILLAHHALP